MPLDEISQQGIAEACEVIGCQCQSLDRFVSLAVGYLTCKYESVQIEQQGDRWLIKSGPCCGGDEVLAVAVAEAVIESTFGNPAS